VAVSRGALLDVLTSQLARADAHHPLTAKLESLGIIGTDTIDAESLKHMAHWIRRGWHPSLEYYLWSRHSAYIDTHDPKTEKRRETLRRYLDESGPPARLEPTGEVVPLPAPAPIPETSSIGTLLTQRHTVRRYSGLEAEAAVLSAVLWHGLAAVRRLRAASDSEGLLGYLYSHGVAFDWYIVAYSTSDLRPGVYYYALTEHSCIQLAVGTYREEMVSNLCDTKAPRTANWTLVLVADFAQYQWRYRHERALRNLYAEAGILAQRVILAGLLYGLGTLPTPATRDSNLGALLRLDRTRQAPVYTLTMGLQRSRRESVTW
jgi:SagB-type dehydrogenase family enzyme